MTPYLIAFAAAALAAGGFTPLAIRAAWSLGFLDRPNTKLKTHARPVAYGGGVAVALAFALGAFLVKGLLMPEQGFAPWPLGLESLRGIYAISLGAFLALGLGLLDDAQALRPGTKLAGQVLAAVALVLCGLRVRFVHPEWASIAVTVLWVVTVTNAVNFVDIMDGLAASLGLVAGLAFLAFALNSGRHNDALAAAALAGACLGFLPWNWQPARVYLGDAGSHFIGFSLAAIALNLGYSHQNELAVFSPLAILGLPLFDLLLMIVIRSRRGVPPWKGSPDHVPLRLRSLGLEPRQVVAALAGGSAVVSAAVYAASFLPLRAALLAWALFGLAALTLAAWFMSIEMPHERAAPGRGPSPRRRRP